MSTPQFGTPTIVQSGNSVDGTNAGPPTFDNRVFTNFARTLAPPMVRVPRMPLIERVTPSRINAQRSVSLGVAKTRARASVTARKAYTAAQGYANALTMRRR